MALLQKRALYSLGIELILVLALLVVAGAVCITLREGSPQLFQTGLTLTYTACGLLLIYWVSYIYYSRKMGGRE